MYQLLIFAAFMIVGYVFGTLAEKKHFKSIRQREEELKDLPVIMLKRPLNSKDIKKYELVNGSVVISVDYFKRFVASLVNIFGGRISSYETLVDRARREAMLRMKEEARGADEIINIRLETSSISKNAQQNIGAIEVLAYGTAIYRK